jgi:hypothetical protein
MDTPAKQSKNKEYIKTYRTKQKALGRRARLQFLTDAEFNAVRDLIETMRYNEEKNKQ